jgi:sec-independent protein translocase protein TatA
MGLDNPLHVALLVVLLLLVFGAKRLPEMGRSIGTGMREFKDSVTGTTPTLTQSTQQMPAQPLAQPVAQPATPPVTPPAQAQPIGGQAPAQPVAAPVEPAPAQPAPAPVEPAHQG